MPYSLSLSPAVLLELLLAWILLLCAFLFGWTGRAFLVLCLRGARTLERRPAHVIALAGVLPILLRLLLLPIDPLPHPQVIEEYSHLLQADTYAHGRLVNPVHPLSILLQAYQVIEWPHRLSARMPLEGIFLWLGQVLFGSPFLGNLLSVGLAAASLSWMLFAWVGRRWATIGSVVTVLTFCLFGFWVNTFWCPSPMVIGGALLLGLVPLLEHRPRWWHAILFVAGLALLAGTRPFEDGVFAATIALWLAVSFLAPERRGDLRRTAVTFILPVVIGGGAILLAQATYDLATTGNASLAPYSIWRATQSIAQPFLWQADPARPVYTNMAARHFALWEVKVVHAVNAGGPFGAVLLFSRHAVTFRDLLGPLLFLPFLCWAPFRRTRPLPASARAALLAFAVGTMLLLAIAYAWAGVLIKVLVLGSLVMHWRNRADRLPVLLLVAIMIATSLTSFYMNVYLTAFTAPLLVLTIRGLENLARSWRPIGASLGGYALLGTALLPLIGALALAQQFPFYGRVLSRFDVKPNEERALAEATLNHIPGTHLVFVRPSKWLSSSNDVVWNGANVDDQRVVWLRDLAPGWTARARAYYRGRRTWLAKMDREGKLHLEPYPRAAMSWRPASLPLPQPDRHAAELLGARSR